MAQGAAHHAADRAAKSATHATAKAATAQQLGMGRHGNKGAGNKRSGKELTHDLILS